MWLMSAVTDEQKVAHLDFVGDFLQELPLDRARGFGVWMLERMLSIYSRAAEGQTWGDHDLLHALVGRIATRPASELDSDVTPIRARVSPTDVAGEIGLRTAVGRTIAEAALDYSSAARSARWREGATSPHARSS
jgi:hypothetical protein